MGRVVNNGNVAVSTLMLVVRLCTGREENHRGAGIWLFSGAVGLFHLRAADGEFLKYLNLSVWGSLLEIPLCWGAGCWCPHWEAAVTYCPCRAWGCTVGCGQSRLERCEMERHCCKDEAQIWLLDPQSPILAYSQPAWAHP